MPVIPRDPAVFSVGSLRRGFHALEQGAKRADDGVVTFAEQRSEDVLADPLAPDVIAAITPRDRGGIEVDPVGMVASDYVVLSVTNTPPVEFERSFESVEINAAGGGEIDAYGSCFVCHHPVSHTQSKPIRRK